MKMLSILAAALSVAAVSTAASAATLYDADLFEGPGVYFGTGNLNGHWTINNDAAELGLRARPHLENAVSPVGNLYTVALNKNISLDFSAMWATGMVTNFSSLLTIKNLGTGGTATFAPELIPDNEHPDDVDSFSGFQNSERFSFSFLNGDLMFNVGDIDYNNAVNGSYLVTWIASADQFSAKTVQIQINQGAGITAVPEPGTWALMILGFGGVGAMLRRRQFAFA